MIQAALPEQLPTLAFQAVLVFARLGATVMLLPGLGEQEVPAPVRMALGLALVTLALPSLLLELPPAPDSATEAVRLILLECATGLWLGGLARLVTLALALAGQVMALLMGLSTLLVPDAQLGAQGAATGRLLTLLAAILMLSSGLYGIPLRALVESYALLPAGAPWPAGATAEAFAVAVGQSLALALRLAAPFVAGAVVINLALGLLARIAPQVQVYFVAVPGQILAGVALLAFLLPALLAAFEDAAHAAFLALPGMG